MCVVIVSTSYTENIVRAETSQPPLIQTTKNETTNERGRTGKKYIHKPGDKRDQNAQQREAREGVDKTIGFENKGVRWRFNARGRGRVL